MMRGLLIVLLVVAAGCGGRSPADAVRSAVSEAQAGRHEAFLDHFEPASRSRLGLFWAVSEHYGYVDSETLRRVADLEIREEQVDGDHATVTVFDGEREGPLHLTRIDGSWKILLPPVTEATP
jgi:hypothetical protein